MSARGSCAGQLRGDIRELLAQAEATDREDQDPQKLPAEIARRGKLLRKMDEACAQLEARAAARAQAERADYERKVAARAEREGSSKGPEPKAPKDTPESDAQINLTDADARLMRKSKREGYTQSYNCQALVDADGSQLIVGQRVSTCASDAGELEPGLELYVSVHSEDAHAERRYDYRPLEKIKAPKTLKDPVLVAMAGKLKAPEGKATYRKRACSVEPVFGIIPSTSLRALRQSGAWVPAVPAARLGESQRRMEPGVPGLQLQTATPAAMGRGRQMRYPNAGSLAHGAAAQARKNSSAALHETRRWRLPARGVPSIGCRGVSPSVFRGFLL